MNHSLSRFNSWSHVSFKTWDTSVLWGGNSFLKTPWIAHTSSWVAVSFLAEYLKRKGQFDLVEFTHDIGTSFATEGQGSLFGGRVLRVVKSTRSVLAGFQKKNLSLTFWESTLWVIPDEAWCSKRPVFAAWYRFLSHEILGRVLDPSLDLYQTYKDDLDLLVMDLEREGLRGEREIHLESADRTFFDVLHLIEKGRRSQAEVELAALLRSTEDLMKWLGALTWYLGHQSADRVSTLVQQLGWTQEKSLLNQLFQIDQQAKSEALNVTEAGLSVFRRSRF